MGSPEELNETPQLNDGEITPAGSKAESINMDLYIDPVKERKMMLKFDVSPTTAHFQRRALTQLGMRDWYARSILHDGKP